MISLKPLLIVAVGILPSYSSAQGLVPTVNSEFDVCLERPLQPQWIDDLEPQEAYRGLLVQMIYRAQSYQRVMDAGECSCETRFPTWDASVAQYNNNYLGFDQFETMDMRQEYRNQANTLRRSVKALCEAEGNW